MYEGYREITTTRDADGNFRLRVRAVEKGRFVSVDKSFSRTDDARAVHAELESSVRGRPYDPNLPEAEQA